MSTFQERKEQAEEGVKEAKKIIKRMQQYARSPNKHAVEMASAFFQILGHHINEGDLKPQNVSLAAYLRKCHE